MIFIFGNYVAKIEVLIGAGSDRPGVGDDDANSAGADKPGVGDHEANSARVAKVPNNESPVGEFGIGAQDFQSFLPKSESSSCLM